jgi:hypothetical protein
MEDEALHGRGQFARLDCYFCHDRNFRHSGAKVKGGANIETPRHSRESGNPALLSAFAPLREKSSLVHEGSKAQRKK